MNLVRGNHEMDFYRAKRPGFIAWIARIFELNYGWQEVTYAEMMDRYFNTKDKN